MISIIMISSILIMLISVEHGTYHYIEHILIIWHSGYNGRYDPTLQISPPRMQPPATGTNIHMIYNVHCDRNGGFSAAAGRGGYASLFIIDSFNSFFND